MLGGGEAFLKRATLLRVELPTAHRPLSTFFTVPTLLLRPID